MAYTLEQYSDYMKEVGTQSGLGELKADADGLISLGIEDLYEMNIQFISQTSKILIFVELLKLPKDADRDVYRELLSAQLFGNETAGGYFSLEPISEAVLYNYIFDFDPIASPPDVFIHLLEQILTLSDMWAERIKRVLTGSTGEESDLEQEALPQNTQNFFP